MDLAQVTPQLLEGISQELGVEAKDCNLVVVVMTVTSISSLSSRFSVSMGVWSGTSSLSIRFATLSPTLRSSFKPRLSLATASQMDNLQHHCTK